MKFNLSIVIPFYRKLEEFKYALQYNKSQFERANEVILICDEVVCIEDFIFLSEYVDNYNKNFIIM
jgi:hypothetical protein